VGSAETPQRYPKLLRLRRRTEFQHVFDTGHRAHGRLLTLLLAPNQAGISRLGIVASRKLGDAVRRNRAKRLIREVFRRNPPPGGARGMDIVVIPRRDLIETGYSSVENDFRSALTRCAARAGHAKR
jgi:ribonuclease P protein component